MTSKFEVISGLVLSTPASLSLTADFYNLKRHFLITASNLPIFADSLFNEVEWKEGIESYYDDAEVMNVNKWHLDFDILTYDNSDYDIYDNHPLTSLYYLAKFFFLSYNITLDGEVILYNFEGQSSIVIVYEIKDSIFNYKVNKSIEYTRHWKNCIAYYEGREVPDINYPVCSSNFHQNRFINFIQNHSEYNPLDFLPEEIFEDTVDFLGFW